MGRGLPNNKEINRFLSVTMLQCYNVATLKESGNILFLVATETMLKSYERFYHTRGQKALLNIIKLYSCLQLYNSDVYNQKLV